MKRLVPAQGDGTRPNEVSAAIPGGEAAGNDKHQPRRFLASAGCAC
ncbi:hypothetical protein [Methylotuvimicrobium sp. KM1]